MSLSRPQIDPFTPYPPPRPNPASRARIIASARSLTCNLAKMVEV